MFKAGKTKLYEAHATGRMLSLEGRPLASFRARAGAFLLDMTVVLVAVVAVGLPAALREVRLGRTEVLAVPFDPFHSMVGFGITVAYFGLVTWLWRGRTPGKRLMKIRVVSLSHEKITLWQSVERALGYGASALEAGFGFFQVFLHANRQAVHDRIAETVVVQDDSRAVAAESAPAKGPEEPHDDSLENPSE